MKFKIGDKVECIVEYKNENRSPVPIKGNIYTISDYDGRLPKLKEIEKLERGHICAWDDDHFKLIKDDNSELRELIFKANEGHKAVSILQEKYSGKYQQKHTFIKTSNWEIPNFLFVQYEFRAKKKSFEPFNIEHGEVKISDDTLFIGCKNFNVEYVENALISLCKYNCSHININHYTDAKATKIGIQLNEHLLKWEDADRILKQLEEMGN